MNVPAEIIINIAEHLDPATLRSLMATSSQVRSLLYENERAICMAKFGIVPGVPITRALTSFRTQRYVVSADRFAYLYEVERRTERIETLVEMGLLDVEDVPFVNMVEMTPQALDRLRRLAQRALAICDYISDAAANVEDPNSDDDIRAAQDQYMRSLNPEDLASLVYLFSRLSKWIEQDIGFGSHTMDLAIANVILGNGSRFLWSFFDQPGPMRRLARDVFVNECVMLYDTLEGMPAIVENTNGLLSILAQCREEKIRSELPFLSALAMVHTRISDQVSFFLQ